MSLRIAGSGVSAAGTGPAVRSSGTPFDQVSPVGIALVQARLEDIRAEQGIRLERDTHQAARGSLLERDTQPERDRRRVAELGTLGRAHPEGNQAGQGNQTVPGRRAVPRSLLERGIRTERDSRLGPDKHRASERA